MAINTKKVVVGGLVAGVFFIVVDLLSNLVLIGDRFAAELEAAAPGATARLEDAIGVLIVSSLVWGLVVAWTYAAMRPRFGPGPKTAVYAGLTVWAVAILSFMILPVAGLISGVTFAMSMVIWLVATPAGALLAGLLYSEDEPAIVSAGSRPYTPAS
jgi:hypothetical protein